MKVKSKDLRKAIRFYVMPLCGEPLLGAALLKSEEIVARLHKMGCKAVNFEIDPLDKMNRIERRAKKGKPTYCIFLTEDEISTNTIVMNNQDPNKRGKNVFPDNELEEKVKQILENYHGE